MCSVLARLRLKKLDFYGNLKGASDVCHLVAGSTDNSFEEEFEHYSKRYGSCVGSVSNQNVTDAQRELLICHWKFGIDMKCVQRLTKKYVYNEPNSKHTTLSSIIKLKFVGAQ